MKARAAAGLIALLLALVAPSVACSSKGCNDVAEIVFPVINVVDAKTGDAICDATIVPVGVPNVAILGAASDAGAVEESGCEYMLALGPGTYTIQVSRVGYEAQTVSDVVVGSNEGPGFCPPTPPPQEVRVALVPM